MMCAPIPIAVHVFLAYAYICTVLQNGVYNAMPVRWASRKRRMRDGGGNDEQGRRAKNGQQDRGVCSLL